MDSQKEDGNIASFMQTVLSDYQQIRGRCKNSTGRPFWDILVLTTIDTVQQEAFELQIAEKVARAEMPVDLPVHIICDPPGVRIGNGGSTLVVLEHLDEKYGSELFKKKVLLIHAGGWSQRMPSCSVLGKAFSLLPYGSPPYQMLDFKLALYWPIVPKIEPGVFLTCADDFVLYCLDKEDKWKIPANGFTAFAHPSPIHIGRGHGVYVLDEMANIDTEKKVLIKDCLEVLQKPTDDMMRARGAVLKGDRHLFAGGMVIDGEAVYSDSCFYFGTDIVKKLLEFKKSVGDLGCEIDAYGDFLQSVGTHASSNYIHNTGNVSQMTQNLIAMRQAVFDCLHGSDIHVLVLNDSVFKHIGTTKELIFHFCQDYVFQNQLGFHKDVFAVWLSDGDKVSRPETVATDSCVMHSVFQQDSCISGNCVIDFCDFDVPVSVARNTILSNCQLKQIQGQTSQVCFPEGKFVHTVPIKVDSTAVKFVTVYFNFDDNLKKSVSLADVETLPYMDSDVGNFLKKKCLAIQDILPESSGKVSKFSLWNLKLFSAMNDMTSSLLSAVDGMSFDWPNNAKDFHGNLYSIADLLTIKDVKSMLKFRKELFKKINLHL